jgi:hypothetical protein
MTREQAIPIVEQWVRERFSDQKLVDVYAFNEDRRMSYRNACCCLLGVTGADVLHDVLHGKDCNQGHYKRLKFPNVTNPDAISKALMLWLSGLDTDLIDKAAALAELAYRDLTLSTFDDEGRAIVFGEILRREMDRRAALREVEVQEEAVTQSA